MPSCAKSRPTDTALKTIRNLSLINFATISRCPQRKRELQLQRFFLCHHAVNPPQLLAVDLRRASRQGLRLQTIPAATPVSRQPSVYGRPVDPKYPRDDLGTFAILNTLHRTHAHLFQRLMIQLSRVVFSHDGRESISIHAVKQNIELLVNGLIIQAETSCASVTPFLRSMCGCARRCKASRLISIY